MVPQCYRTFRPWNWSPLERREATLFFRAAIPAQRTRPRRVRRAPIDSAPRLSLWRAARSADKLLPDQTEQLVGCCDGGETTVCADVSNSLVNGGRCGPCRHLAYFTVNLQLSVPLNERKEIEGEVFLLNSSPLRDTFGKLNS